MTFIHRLLPIHQLERVEIDGLRHYKTPEGEHYKSITTILFERLPKAELDAWRLRVGDAEADAVSLQATNRGTAVHDMCEKYLLNEEHWKKGQMPFNVETFRGIKNVLDKTVTEVYGIEIPLFSRHLKTAGTADFVCLYNGIPTIGDFKTSRWEKEEKHIYSYFIQLTAYSIMLQEMYDIAAKQCVVIMAVDHGEPKIFKFNRDKYLDETIKIFTGK